MLYDMVDFKVARFIGAPTCGNNRLDLKNLHMDSLNIGNSFSTGRTISNNFGLVLGLALKNDLRLDLAFTYNFFHENDSFRRK